MDFVILYVAWCPLRPVEVTLHTHPRKTGGLSVISGLPSKGVPLKTAEFVEDFRAQMTKVDHFVKKHFDQKADKDTRDFWHKFFTVTFPEAATDAATYMKGKTLYVPFAEALFGLAPMKRDEPSVAGEYETQGGTY
jgi:hypothetical protein